MQRLWLVLAAFLGLAATAVPASADIVYTLACSSTSCSPSGNYGTVTLHQIGTGVPGSSTNIVEVTVNLATAGNNFAGTGAGFAITWNVTGNPDLTTTLVPTDVNHPLLAGEIYDTSHFAIQDNTDPGNTYKASPFGNTWMYAIDYGVSGGRSTNDNKLIFDVTKTNGLLLSNFSALNGFLFTVDIFGGPCSPTCVVATKVEVPEPQTWLMFFVGLAGLTALVVLQRRRKPARAA